MNNEEKILAMLEKLTGDVAGIKGDVAGIKGDVAGVKGDVTALKEKVEELDQRSLRSAVMLENDVSKKIQLVYEGQELLRQKMDELAPKERMEVLEDRVITLETVIKSMSKRLSALEKAQ